MNSLKMDVRNEEFYKQGKQREENEEEAPEWWDFELSLGLGTTRTENKLILIFKAGKTRLARLMTKTKNF